jgi:hypothetical protein
MSSDWVSEHNGRNATKGGAPMAWCRKTPPRREGRPKPYDQVEPSPPLPPPLRLHVPSHSQEGVTCALEALGMTPRVSALWGDKTFFWFTTWT